MSLKIPPPTPAYATPRPPWSRVAWFVAALAISLGLHGWLWTELPALPVGRITLRERPLRTQTEPMRLDKVQPLPDLSPYVQPARFRPENPDAFQKVAERQDDLLGEFIKAEADRPYAVPDPAPVARPQDIVPEDAFAATPEAYRQEVLEIEQKLASDELAALPRRVEPAVTRVQGAPDVTLAASAAEIATAALAATGPGQPSALPLPGDVPQPTPLPPQDTAVLQSLPTIEATTLFEADREALAAEPADEISDITPIEDRLALHTTTFRDASEDALYFQVQISRSAERALPVLPKDILLVQDCSESITRSKLDYFKEALETYLRTLTTVDRFNIMRYDESATLCFPDWAPATAENLTEGARFVRSMRLHGKTDLYASLQQILHLSRDPARPMLVLLLTDGRPTMGLMDNSDIISRFSRLNDGNVSVFTIGAGDNVNGFLLDMLAQDNRGGTWTGTDRAQIPDLAATASRELARPCLMNLTYRMGGNLRAEIYPPALTHLYVDRPLTLVGRAPLDAAEGVLQVVGTSGGQTFDMVFPVSLQDATPGNSDIRRQWAQQKIYAILNANLDARTPAAEAEARALAEKYHVPLGW